MKKFLFLILSVFLAFTFALSGCSCAPESFLEFETVTTNNIKTETLVYDVEWRENYKSITLSQDINKALLPTYEGSLTLEFNSTGKQLPNDADGNQIPQHIKFDQIETFNYIKSVLDLKVKIGEDEYNDKIISEVYFYDAEWALAPVYSKTTVKNTFIAMTAKEIEADQNIYEYTTLYKNGNFTFTKKYYNKQKNEDINLVDIENLDQTKMKSLSGNGSSHEYGLRKAIDNVQLIFAIRNSNIKKDKSTTLPTITYMYNNPMNLLVKNESESSSPVNFDYNGVNIESNMLTKNLTISLSGTNHVGSKKYLTLQRDSLQIDSLNNLANYSLPIEYAESIFENISFNTIGALVYKLKSVDITTK